MAEAAPVRSRPLPLVLMDLGSAPLSLPEAVASGAGRMNGTVVTQEEAHLGWA